MRNADGPLPPSSLALPAVVAVVALSALLAWAAASVAVTRDGKSLYVGDNASTTSGTCQFCAKDGIVHFQRSATTGGLSFSDCVGPAGPTGVANPDCGQTAAGAEDVTSIVLSPDGTSLYGISEDDYVSWFERSTATGALTPEGCIGNPTFNTAGCGQTANGLLGAVGSPHPAAISPDGTSLYVVGTNSVRRFVRNATTGALTNGGCIGDMGHNTSHCAKVIRGLRDVSELAITADGKSLYAGTGSAIVHFQRAAVDGALTSHGCTAEAGFNPEGCQKTAPHLGAEALALAPDGKALYAANPADNALIHFSRDPANGALTYNGCAGDAGHNLAQCTQTAEGLRGVTDLAITRDGSSLYAAGDNSVVHFQRDAAGALTAKGCIGDAAHNLQSCPRTAKGLAGLGTFEFGVLAPSRDNHSLYAVGHSVFALVHFERSP